jgi:hypothetical protein
MMQTTSEGEMEPHGGGRGIIRDVVDIQESGYYVDEIKI